MDINQIKRTIKMHDPEKVNAQDTYINLSKLLEKQGFVVHPTHIARSTGVYIRQYGFCKWCAKGNYKGAGGSIVYSHSSMGEIVRSKGAKIVGTGDSTVYEVFPLDKE